MLLVITLALIILVNALFLHIKPALSYIFQLDVIRCRLAEVSCAVYRFDASAITIVCAMIFDTSSMENRYSDSA